MLDAKLKQQLDTYLQMIVSPIELQVSADDSPKGHELRSLSRDIESLSRQISLGEADGVRTPSLAIGPVPGEQQYRGKGVAYCPHCDGPLFKGKRVAVVGGGNSGIEAAIDLAGIVEHVTQRRGGAS